MLQKAQKLLKVYEESDDFNPNEVSFLNAASVTNNNLGCYFQKQHDFKNGLKYLEIALKYNENIEDDEINQVRVFS